MGIHIGIHMGNPNGNPYGNPYRKDGVSFRDLGLPPNTLLLRESLDLSVLWLV